MPFVGIGVGRQRFPESEGGFDADYQAVLDYATTQGYTLPSASQQTLQNQLVVDLKSAGIWSKLDTFGVFATDGDSDFALIDWIRLMDYTAVNSPTFTTNQGFTGDGVSAYIDSNLNLSTGTTNYTQDSASYGGYFLQIGSASQSLIGNNSAVNNISRFTSTFRYEINGANTNTVPIFSIGTLHANRSNSNATEFYNNGVNINNDNDGSSLVISANLRYLSDTSNFTTSQISVGFAGADLSAESSDLHNSLNTYITSL